MGGGVSILLIVAIGIGFFLGQNYRSMNRENNPAQGGLSLSDKINSFFRNHNRNHDRGSAATAHSAPVNQVQAPPRSAHNRPLVPSLRDSITETGPMVYFANDRHGRSDKEYRFNFKKVNGGWRAYILRTPSFGNNSTGSGVIHRLHDNSGYYICWDRPVNTLKDMQIISRRWADSIQEYMSTGRFG